jgi:single-stranded-DNA-specific exonuclease
MKAYQWEFATAGKVVQADQVVPLLLKNRGISSKKAGEVFLHPPPPDTISPASVGINPDELSVAVTRILKARNTDERVIVYGDYDADGITATAILWETLYGLGLRVKPYIPDRVAEGYGLNEEAIAKLKREDPALGLIVTVDHGIVGHKKINFARELGLEVIVSDHHQPGGTKPRALAVVHTTKLSGSGVAWMLAREVRRKAADKASGEGQDGIDQLLELVAIGTIADLLPLIGANRALVKFGLASLNRTTRPGLIALARVAGIDPGNIGTYEVGYILAPRLNAMGRLENALESLRLLCTKDDLRAKDLAEELQRTNRDRQQLTEETTNHARQILLNSLISIQKTKLIFVAHESYQQGVIGLVAGKLAEEYYLPSVILAKGTTYTKASARSIAGFNIIEAIRQMGDLLVEAGGHPMAAGFTVETAKLEDLRQKLAAITATRLARLSPTRTLRIEALMPLAIVSKQLSLALTELEPFGQGNTEPIFASQNVGIVSVRPIGAQRQHLKFILQLNKEGETIEAVAFRMGEIYPELVPDKPIDIAYSIARDTWHGQERLQLKIKDLKIHKTSTD